MGFTRTSVSRCCRSDSSCRFFASKFIAHLLLQIKESAYKGRQVVDDGLREHAQAKESY